VQKRAAELLKIKPTTLNEMIKRHEIGTRRKRASAAGNDEDEATAATPAPSRQSLPATQLTRE